MLIQVLVNSFGGTLCAVAGALQANGTHCLQGIPTVAMLGGFLVWFQVLFLLSSRDMSREVCQFDAGSLCMLLC